MRRAILQRFRDRYGEKQIASMPPKFILAMLAAMPPHAARNWFKTLRAFCQFCVEPDIIKTDPTIGIRLPKVRDSGGHHTWTDDEVAAYEAKHPVGSKARLALALGVYTMQRRGGRRAHGPATRSGVRCDRHPEAAAEIN